MCFVIVVMVCLGGLDRKSLLVSDGVAAAGHWGGGQGVPLGELARVIDSCCSGG